MKTVATTTDGRALDRGDEGSGRELREYVRILRTYWWAILLLIGLTSAIAALITQRQPRIFEAVCTVEYDPNPPRPLGEGVEEVSAPASDFWASREFFETQNHLIRSRVIAERVVTRLGLHRDRTFLEDPDDAPGDWSGQSVESAAILLQHRLSVEEIMGTRIVSIRVLDRNPERAALIANTIAEVFIEKTIEDRLGSTVTALEWLGDQLDTLRTELDGAELALHHFKRDHNVLSVSMEDRQNLVANEIERLSQGLTDARTRRFELQARVRRLRALVDVGSAETAAASLGDVPTIAALQSQLRSKLAEMDALTSRYGARHPRIEALAREIEALRAQQQAEIEGLVRAADADVREAMSIEAAIDGALDSAHDAGLELNLWEIEYSRLQRDRENRAKLYQVVLERTTETDLTRMLRTTHVRTVDRAIQPHRPVSPRIVLNLGIGAAAGLFLGFAGVFVLGRLDRKVRGASEIEELGLPVLGIVPLIDETMEASAGERRRRRRAVAAQTSPRDLVAHSHPMSSTAESFRSVRTNLMFMGDDRESLKVLAVTSAGPREGKTTVATNLAISFAQSGKRVLLIDTDLRRPRVHSVFSLPNVRGVTTVISGQMPLADVVQDSAVQGLSVVSSGPIPPNPAELLHRDRFHEMVRTARSEFDLVVFDTPPIGLVTDAAVLAPRTDGVLIVARVGETTRDGVQEAVRRISHVGGRVVGAVVNGWAASRGRYGQYYYSREGGYFSHAEGGAEQASAPPPGE